MKTKNILYLITAGIFALAAAGCGEIPVDGPGGLPPVLESVDVRLGDLGVVVTRTPDADDPSVTECHNRCASLHRLAVTIGSDDSNMAYYAYDDAELKWLPESAGVRFPDFGNHDVRMRLCSGLADPVAGQTDGSALNLLHADVLVASLSGQAPARNLPPATMTHMHSLFDIRFGSSITAADIESVKVNGTLTPYNVEDNGGKGRQYLVITTPGTDDSQITIRYKGADYTCTVKAADARNGRFAAHTRYVMNFGLQGGKLVCGGIIVKPWNESAGAETETGATRFEITGYGGKTLDVKIAGVALFSGILELDASGRGTLPFIDLPDYGAQIEYVRYPGHLQIPVNMPLGSLVSVEVDPLTGEVI